MEHIVCTNIMINTLDLPEFPVKIFAQRNTLYAVCIGDCDFTQQFIDKGFNIQRGDSNCAEQIKAYFDRKLKTFELEFHFWQGGIFAQQIWQALCTIPYGNVTTYSHIAEIVDKPKASRAVGNAVGKNPMPIVVPCHRVLRADGKLGGFSANFAKIENFGLKLKQNLLEFEKS